MGFSLPKQSKDLDPSYKMDLDLWDSFGGKSPCLMEEIWSSNLILKHVLHDILYFNEGKFCNIWMLVCYLVKL